jgi:hypothetical protein
MPPPMNSAPGAATGVDLGRRTGTTSNPVTNQPGVTTNADVGRRMGSTNN